MIFISFVGHPRRIAVKTFSTSTTLSEKSYSEHLENLHRSGVRFGQPTQFSHPHLLRQNELAIGVLPNEFAERRQGFMEKIKAHCIQHGKSNRNIVSIDRYRLTDIFQGFNQQSNQ